MKTVLTTLSLAICAFASASALAAPERGQFMQQRGQGFAMLDTDKSGTISQAEACNGPRGAEGMLCKNFASVDANNDGQLSKDELGEFRAAMKEKFAKGKLDANGDGSISQAEACAGPKGADGLLCKNFAKVDANNDGVVSKMEMRAARAMHMHHVGFNRMDADQNGAISQAEACGGPRGAEGKLCKAFDAIDTNKDGSLSKEELQAARAAHRGPGRGG
jgi:Ca2+-binding EF-hand superfamily protein